MTEAVRETLEGLVRQDQSSGEDGSSGVQLEEVLDFDKRSAGGVEELLEVEVVMVRHANEGGQRVVPDERRSLRGRSSLKVWIHRLLAIPGRRR